MTQLSNLADFINSLRLRRFISMFSAWQSYDQMKFRKQSIRNQTKNIVYFAFIPIRSLTWTLDFLLGILILPFLLTIEFLMIIILWLFASFTTNVASYLDRNLLQQYVKAYSHSGVPGLKYIEGLFFRQEDLIHPSMEIGIERGTTSELHFKHKKFSIRDRRW